MGTDPDPGERPAWLDVDDLAVPGDGAAPTRTRWLFVAAGLPWLVVASLLTRPGGAGADDPAVTAPVPSEGAIEVPASPPAGTASGAAEGGDGSAPDGITGTVTAAGALVAVDEDEARAVAVVAARRWLTTVGPDAPADAPADPPREDLYAEHLVVEGVDHPAPGAAVVTIRAVVLRVDGGSYDGIELRRVAVPLRFDAGGAAPAGDPYLLPVDDPAPTTLEPTEEIEDPDLLLAAGEALAAAGYRDIAVRSLHRTAAWPLVVTADVRVGDHDPPATMTVWLRPHLGRLVVAGTRPRRPASGASDIPSSPAGEPAAEHRPHEHEEEAP